MINSIKTAGKFLDQPILISKLDKSMPKIMAAGGCAIIGKEAVKNFKKNKNETKENKANNNKDLFKKSVVMASSISSALIAPKIASKITKRAGLAKVEEIIENNKKLIDDFIKNNKNLDTTTLEILNKAKQKPLSFKNIKLLLEKFKFSNNGRKFIDKLIPDPENIKAKDIFSEIGFLSVYGAIPVIGGIAGGIASDVLVKDDFKKTASDKINEGIYQYLANIFMCNIGAAGALGILEKLKITSKTARAIGMTAGIVLTGVLGGSKIANTISQKIISPIVQPNKQSKERKPELMDLGLHTDDIATVSLLSGLKWIEPSLPILYSVSGYKSGIGYRN